MIVCLYVCECVQIHTHASQQPQAQPQAHSCESTTIRCVCVGDDAYTAHTYANPGLLSFDVTKRYGIASDSVSFFLPPKMNVLRKSEGHRQAHSYTVVSGGSVSVCVSTDTQTGGTDTTKMKEHEDDDVVVFFSGRKNEFFQEAQQEIQQKDREKRKYI